MTVKELAEQIAISICRSEFIWHYGPNPDTVNIIAGISLDLAKKLKEVEP